MAPQSPPGAPESAIRGPKVGGKSRKRPDALLRASQAPWRAIPSAGPIAKGMTGLQEPLARTTARASVPPAPLLEAFFPPPAALSTVGAGDNRGGVKSTPLNF